ncbi:hypothetical protein L7F22_003572, partial [Adiantum nelumboides]|nr:hypothetical protein [Adiantum nelumboides]
FPIPHGNIVREDALFSHMGKILRCKRSEIEKAIKGSYKKPSWCSKQLWDLAKERHRSNVAKWSQQCEARKVQLETQGTHKLGSGGKARFKALFTGEYPDFVERTPDDEDKDDKDYLPTDEEECEETSESEE